jgi:putative SOS response-associated peptidase YedK
MGSAAVFYEGPSTRETINARAETVATSGMFESAYARRRCIVPADAFYEWNPLEGGKQPCAIARRDGQPMVFAGLWEGFKWPDGTATRTFTIITTYDRMPVILEPVGWQRCLGEVVGNPSGLLNPACDLP